MPFTPEAVKNFLTLVVLPVVSGAIVAWLFATVHVFSLFGITEGQVAGELVQFGTWAITAGITALFAHFHLKGVYSTAAFAAGGRPRAVEVAAPPTKTTRAK